MILSLQFRRDISTLIFFIVFPLLNIIPQKLTHMEDLWVRESLQSNSFEIYAYCDRIPLTLFCFIVTALTLLFTDDREILFHYNSLNPLVWKKTILIYYYDLWIEMFHIPLFYSLSSRVKGEMSGRWEKGGGSSQKIEWYFAAEFSEHAVLKLL